MKAFFVTNGSPAIGGGHIMRCLTLAREIQRRGGEVAFAVNPEALSAAPALKRSGFRVEAVEHLSQAGALAAGQGGADVIICDSYDIASDVEAGLRAFARRLVVIDDLANRRHDCDLLIDNAFGREARDYAGLVPASAQVLAGATYALLRPEFAALRAEALARRAGASDARHILVSLGLTDVRAITARVVSRLTRLARPGLIEVVIGPDAPSRATLERLALNDSRIRLHVDPPDIARLMTQADIAIGAGGATSWERCCLGLPTLLVILADNQRLIAQNLVAAGAALDAFQESAEQLDGLTERLQAAMEDRALLGAVARACAGIVDGEGARRVADTITLSLTAAANLSSPAECGHYRLRSARPEDALFLFALRNDPVTRAASHDMYPLDWSAHEAWFAHALNDHRRHIFIAESWDALADASSDLRVGMVRADRMEPGWLLSWSVSPAHRGAGVGAHIVALAARALPDALRAEVKENNMASARIAERAGLRLLGTCDGVRHYSREALQTALLPNLVETDAHAVS